MHYQECLVWKNYMSSLQIIFLLKSANFTWQNLNLCLRSLIKYYHYSYSVLVWHHNPIKSGYKTTWCNCVLRVAPKEAKGLPFIWWNKLNCKLFMEIFPDVSGYILAGINEVNKLKHLVEQRAIESICVCSNSELLGIAFCYTILGHHTIWTSYRTA